MHSVAQFDQRFKTFQDMAKHKHPANGTTLPVSSDSFVGTGIHNI